MWSGLWGEQTVAIKMLKQIIAPCESSKHDQVAADAFRIECDALQSIRHPNLIVFLGAGTTSAGQPFIVME